MEITFRTRRLEKVFSSAAGLQRAYGRRMAEVIRARVGLLEGARNLALVPPFPPARRHQLGGGRYGQFALDLVHPHRLVFVPGHDPIPRRDDGGIDLERVIEVTIIEVTDYH